MLCINKQLDNYVFKIDYGELNIDGLDGGAARNYSFPCSESFQPCRLGKNVKHQRDTMTQSAQACSVSALRSVKLNFSIFHLFGSFRENFSQNYLGALLLLKFREHWAVGRVNAMNDRNLQGFQRWKTRRNVRLDEAVTSPNAKAVSHWIESSKVSKFMSFLKLTESSRKSFNHVRQLRDSTGSPAPFHEGASGGFLFCFFSRSCETFFPSFLPRQRHST